MIKKIKNKILIQIRVLLRFLLKILGEPEHPECVLCKLNEMKIKNVMREAPGVFGFNINKKGVFNEFFGSKEIGVKEDRIIGKSVFELYYDNKDITESFLKAVNGDIVQKKVEIPIKKTIKHFHIVFYPYREKNVIAGVMGIAINISAEISAMEFAQKSEKQAKMADKLKTSFLANMSHEIRTPMNAIIGFSQLLEQTLPPEEFKSYVKIIDYSGNALLAIINDIIDMSKIESGQTTIIKETFDVDELVQTIVSSFAFKQKDDVDLFIQRQVFSIEPLHVYSDENRVRQILINLVSNALKFTDKGRVDVGYNIDQQNITFYVKDTGIGIPQNMIEKVFDRFVRVNDFNENNTKEKEGTGLGLTISRSLVTLLDGKMWVESKEYEGSTFYFTIPYIQKPIKKMREGENIIKEKTLKE
ncbi:TPA: hypothetical protein DEP21_02155 [Patescibacteria group bacterium]|nr:hypothetical protein [Candidatus Gracilibacteria bacterium]